MIPPAQHQTQALLGRLLFPNQDEALGFHPLQRPHLYVFKTDGHLVAGVQLQADGAGCRHFFGSIAHYLHAIQPYGIGFSDGFYFKPVPAFWF